MSYAQQRHIQKFWIQATNDEDNHREREQREEKKTPTMKWNYLARKQIFGVDVMIL